MDPTTTPPAPPARPYTTGEISSRIRVYVVIGALASLIGSVGDLGAMSDAQLHDMSAVRWTLKLFMLGLGAALAGCNAFRAAIDRSTATAGTPLPLDPAAGLAAPTPKP